MMFYLSIHLLISIFFSNFWMRWIIALWTFAYKFSCGYTYSLLSNRSNFTMLGYYVLIIWLTTFLIIWLTSHLFSKVVALVYIPSNIKFPFSLLSCPEWFLSFFRTIAVLVGCSPWGREELDTTERLHFHFSLFTFVHWRRKWQPTPVFLPGKSQGRGSLVGCHLRGCTELDTTEAT